MKKVICDICGKEMSEETRRWHKFLIQPANKDVAGNEVNKDVCIDCSVIIMDFFKLISGVTEEGNNFCDILDKITSARVISIEQYREIFSYTSIAISVEEYINYLRTAITDDLKAYQNILATIANDEQGAKQKIIMLKANPKDFNIENEKELRSAIMRWEIFIKETKECFKKAMKIGKKLFAKTLQVP